MTRWKGALLVSRFALVLLLLLGCAGDSRSEEPQTRPPERRDPKEPTLRVLFVGNSLTYANDLPLMVQAFARAAGLQMHVDSVTMGGFSLDDHWSHGAAPRAISNGRWDVVVLQHGPSSLPGSRVELRASAKKYDRIIRKAGGRPAFYMVWPSLDRFAYFDDVRESYSLAAADVGGIFIPAGEAWRAAWRRDPDAPLYDSDDFHPSLAGSYAAALSIYGMLTGRPPQGLPAQLRLANRRTVDVPPALARLLQEAAAEANRTYGRR